MARGVARHAGPADRRDGAQHAWSAPRPAPRTNVRQRRAGADEQRAVGEQAARRRPGVVRGERPQAAAEAVADDGRADRPADGEGDPRRARPGVHRGSGTTASRSGRDDHDGSVARTHVARGSGRSSRQTGAALEPPGLEDGPTGPGAHAGAEPVLAGPATGVRLEGALHVRLRTRSIDNGDDSDCRRRPRSLWRLATGVARRPTKATARCDAPATWRSTAARRPSDGLVSGRPAGRGSVVRPTGSIVHRLWTMVWIWPGQKVGDAGERPGSGVDGGRPAPAGPAHRGGLVLHVPGRRAPRGQRRPPRHQRAQQPRPRPHPHPLPAARHRGPRRHRRPGLLAGHRRRRRLVGRRHRRRAADDPGPGRRWRPGWPPARTARACSTTPG